MVQGQYYYFVSSGVASPIGGVQSFSHIDLLRHRSRGAPLPRGEPKVLVWAAVETLRKVFPSSERVRRCQRALTLI
jgi:hypothetical protein